MGTMPTGRLLTAAALLSLAAHGSAAPQEDAVPNLPGYTGPLRSN